MSQKSDIVKAFERLPTGIGGFDRLLNGGILKGGTYLLMGPPGSGKTILANQMAFNHVAQGGAALYVTMLAESHGRLFGNIKPFGFFNESAITGPLNYISAYQILEKEGLDGLIRSLAALVRKNRAGLLFIDGIASIEGLSKTPVSFKKFVHDLNTVLATSGCTAFLLSSLDATTHYNPEHTMVDGIFSLTFYGDGMRTVREIEVRKFRGSSHLYGKHLCKIDQRGMTVYPRIELVFGKEAFDEKREPIPACSFGLPKLDRLLSGGVPTGTTTALLGAAGTGKTWLGNRFLEAGAKLGQKGVYLGFYEAPERMIRKMEKMGTPLQDHIDNGLIEIIWQSPTEHTVDEIGVRLIETVRRTGARRVFLDGIGGMANSMIDKHRLHPALVAIMNELRRMEVAVLFTEETEMFSAEARTPISDQSAVTDNIVYLRHVDLGGKLRRVLSVIKARETETSHEILEILLTPKGMVIDGPIRNADGLLTGSPRLRKEGIALMKGARPVKSRPAARRKK